MEGVEWTKVKHSHRGDTLRHPFEYRLGINTKRQDYKIGTVCVRAGVFVGGGLGE
jgi:hypothetical protein